MRLPTWWSRTLLAAAIGACLLGGCAAVPSAPVDRTDTPAVADWVAATAVPLREIEPDAPLDDLAPVARSFAEAQIVGLGESSHGVTEQLTVKHRVLRLLVEQLGFRSIAWEDDWTTGQMIDADIVSGTGDLAAVMRQMSPQWQFNEVADVLRWLRAFNSGRRDKVREDRDLVRGSGHDRCGDQPGTLTALATGMRRRWSS